MVGQQSLNNFYQSVRFSHPRTAELMHADIQTVAIFALAMDKTPAFEAVERVRETSRDLPEIHRRVLENALIELGFT